MSDLARNNFRIEGLDELIRDLRKFPDEAKVKLQPKVNKGGDILLNKTREKVPKNTGALAESLYVKQNNRKKYFIGNTLTWGDDVRDYAAAVELGHGLKMYGQDTGVYIHEQPFLRPAADESADEVFKLLIDGMDEALSGLGDDL